MGPCPSSRSPWQWDTKDVVAVEVVSEGNARCGGWVSREMPCESCAWGMRSEVLSSKQVSGVEPIPETFLLAFPSSQISFRLNKEWSGIGTDCPGKWRSHHPYRGSRNGELRHSGTWR